MAKVERNKIMADIKKDLDKVDIAFVSLIDKLKEANKNATAVESLLLLQIIRDVNNGLTGLWALMGAQLSDKTDQNYGKKS